MRYIIVDGYNVIRADPRLQSLERASMEQAREVLVQTLSSSPRLANDAITVVFDGGLGTRAHVHTQRRGRVITMYSARGQTADEVIVEHARSMTQRGTVVVVTNDLEVRDNCRAAGCAVTGSDNLLNHMPGRPRPSLEDDEEPTLSTAKRGNPRRSPRKSRRPREFKF